ncbi:MAG: NAD(P)/FAD-dependent oxidoreductase [Candidatus Omnitrophica bacterium]|nr:NAD(P)/FAD-dependent oxidoreductase [Candidatus Omnitrophota bacterium]
MEYDAIIIGAGSGGLAAGLKLSCCGKKVLFIEKQPGAGGFATGFKRKGFSFESSLHCVDALDKEGEVRKHLEAFGVAEKVEFIALKDFMRVIYPEHDFIADFNRAHLVDYLLAAFPGEEKGIKKLFSEFDRFYRQFKKFSSSPLPYWLLMLLSPFIYPAIVKAACLTAGQMIDRRLKDKKLRALITDIWRYMGLPPSKLSALYFLIVFTGFYYDSTVYIKGGYQALFQAIAERIKEKGGVFKFNTSVAKIVTAKGRAVSAVVTESGETYKAKSVISNANILDTLSVMLDDETLKNKYRARLSAMEKSVSAFQVYLGLKLPAKSLGMDHFMFSINTAYDQDANYNYSLSGDYEHCPLILVDHAQLDPGLAPDGKGSLLIMTLDNYANWADLGAEEYRQKKAQVAQKFIQRAEKLLPGLSANIEVMEAATPRTMQRYGISPEGAIYGFAQLPSQSVISRPAQQTGIKGLFLAGAWTRPGAGAHACFVSGIEAADLTLAYLKYC